MKQFPLLSALTKDAASPPIKQQNISEAPATLHEYRVYVFEKDNIITEICIPTTNVDEFDTFYSNNKESIDNIDFIVENFSAIVLN